MGARRNWLLKLWIIAFQSQECVRPPCRQTRTIFGVVHWPWLTPPLIVYMVKCRFCVGCLWLYSFFEGGSLLLNELMRNQQAQRCPTLHRDRPSRWLVVGSGPFCSPPHCFPWKLISGHCPSGLITFKPTSVFLFCFKRDIFNWFN